MPDASAQNRRSLSFDNLEDIARDVRAVTGGPCDTTGGWTAGQICAHLAEFFRISNHGSTVRLPWPMRAIGRLLKMLKVYRRPIKPGIRLPKRAAAAWVPSPGVDLEDSRRDLLDQIALAQRVPMTHPSPLFGPTTHDQWIKLHCRHAELHLSFIHPRPAKA